MYNAYKYVQMFANVFKHGLMYAKCLQIWANVYKYVQMCANVCTYGRMYASVCTNVYNHVQMYANMR